MKTYQPIDCNFYDHLEAFATRRKYVRIQFFSDIHEFQTTDAIIKDLYIRDGYEFMLLSDGMEVRLDRLVSVAGIFVPGRGFDGISCECD
ncbi:MAG: hypothetical protein DHS20C17_07890 [Cyclobacteriaceae bacterium]|nr:MAG: hypothetical protein DHS20C17_07890 [Cyclobacteriaceae bacterium]